MVTATGPIARDPAQRLAREELSKGIYHQRSIIQIIFNTIQSFLQRIFDTASQTAPGGWWTVVALAALAVIVIAVIVTRIGPIARSARRRDPLIRTGPGSSTARQYRDQAEASASEGDYSTAVLERLRAIAASLEERGILPPDPGRTADELATQAAARFPGHSQELYGSSRLFDDVLYGDGTGTLAGYERLRDLDEALTRGPVPAAAG